MEQNALVGQWTVSGMEPFAGSDHTWDIQSDGRICWDSVEIGTWHSLEHSNYYVQILMTDLKGDFTLRVSGQDFEVYDQGQDIWSGRLKAYLEKDWIGHWECGPAGHVQLDLSGPRVSKKTRDGQIHLFSLFEDGSWRVEVQKGKIEMGSWERCSDGRLLLDRGTCRECYFTWDGPRKSRVRVGPFRKDGRPAETSKIHEYSEFDRGVAVPHWSVLTASLSRQPPFPNPAQVTVHIYHGRSSKQWKERMLPTDGGREVAGCWVVQGRPGTVSAAQTG